MSEQIIGIKTGDGKFYPVLEEAFKGKKRFILTTVNNNQTSVQIDFYRSSNQAIDDAEYIGSLVIENIEPAPSREPEIEVVVGIDSENNLHAVAKNLSVESEKQSLTVSLESLASGLTYDIPEFELDEKLQPTSLFEGDQHDFSESDLEEKNEHQIPVEKKKRNPIIVFVIVLLGLVIIAAIFTGIFFLPNWLNKDKPSKPELEAGGGAAPTEIMATAADTKIAMADTPEPSTEPTRAPTQAPAKAAQVTVAPQVKKNTSQAGGLSYTIKKGDTLWDIANRVYGNPWYYEKIYQNNTNKIRNPNLIYSGRKIYLPEK